MRRLKAASGAPSRKSRGPAVIAAIVSSFVIHAGLVACLLSGHAPGPTADADSVEISFDVAEAASIPTSHGAPEETAAAVEPLPHPVAQPSGVQAVPPSVTSSRSERGRAEAEGADGSHGLAAAGEGESAVGGATAAEPPKAGGWATFQPAHPDLRRALRLPSDEGPARDLLAPPAVGPALGSARELPKVLRNGAGVSAQIADDGSIRLHDPKGLSAEPVIGSGVGVGIRGRFDISDNLMKLAGQDPYAAAKAKIADETREQRLCMARRNQGERQKQALLDLSVKIRRIAAQVDVSAAERRRLVFEIWDECLEESEDASAYGAMARATIDAVIREVFPEGTDLASPPAELLAMNERRSSRLPFAPYRQGLAKRSRHPDAGTTPEPACSMP